MIQLLINLWLGYLGWTKYRVTKLVIDVLFYIAGENIINAENLSKFDYLNNFSALGSITSCTITEKKTLVFSLEKVSLVLITVNELDTFLIYCSIRQ